jgi:hypothetical protein
MEKRAANFHEYVMQFPPDVSVRLEQIRNVILQVTPHAEESIRYGMPELEATVSNYRAPNTKDTIHFKHSEALPLGVIRKIAELKLKAG